ncbi:MAG: hypothetical protein J2P36_25590, partial [Ktedonobacteraceae bacterium]|nr:hypothetical protein [Ktedonobacteraceae bacterium]
MDANGTRFQLLLGYDDWSSCIACSHEAPLHTIWQEAASARARNETGLSWDEARQELTLQSLPLQFPAASKDNPPALSNRRGAGRDRYGNWYWIDETRREIHVNSVGTGKTSHFWTVGDGLMCPASTLPSSSLGAFQRKDPPPALPPLLLSGLAVTEDHYLVVGVLDPPGLLIFDLHAGGPPRQVYWPAGVTFAPFDMAARPKGGVWVLDRENCRYWALDRQFNIVREDQSAPIIEQDIFQPREGNTGRSTSRRAASAGFSLSNSSPQIVNPIAIEALPDDTVLILDSSPEEKDPAQSFSRIYRYQSGKQAGPPVATDTDFAVRLIGYDLAFVPEYKTSDTHTQIADQLYIAAADGNQCFAFWLSLKDNGQLFMQLLPGYFPMRLFEGKGIVAADTDVYYDFADGWLPLVRQPRHRYAAAAVLCTPLGTPETTHNAHQRHAFDGHEPDCQWHRLLLDACIPPGTEVLVESRAANDESELALTAWQQEPRLYLRGAGSELPYVRQPPGADGTGTWELLFQGARGRYLQLKLLLRGNSRCTPRLRALRAYYPRFSYLSHYLPAIYREDQQSASFLERFLANLEGFFTNIEDKIAVVQLLFDARSAPPDVLDWLASWFGIVLDPTWDEAKRRLFIKHAMDFFQYRGTMRGLLMALRLTLEDRVCESIFSAQSAKPSRPERVRIVEKYRTRNLPAVVAGDPTVPAGLRIVARTVRWTPDQGRANLHQRYNDFLRQQGLWSRQLLEFSLTVPQLPATEASWHQFMQKTLGIPVPPGIAERPAWQAFFSTAWQQFALDVLGFVPAITDAQVALWRDFLARRYRRISLHNTVYL